MQSEAAPGAFTDVKEIALYADRTAAFISAATFDSACRSVLMRQFDI
jgi:hypothetical protein